MPNRGVKIFVAASVLLLVVVFMLLVITGWLAGSLDSSSSAMGGNAPARQDQEGEINDFSDPLITAVSDLYLSLWRETDPVRGDRDARVIIMEFGDFECVYSAQVYEALVKMVGDYDGQVALVWKDFPIPTHENARTAALAARCAGEQGRFWEYHDFLFANQDQLSRDMYNKIALELGLNLMDFNQCVDGFEKISLVGDGISDGQRLGVDATPYIFVGNNVYDYAAGEGELRMAVERALAR